MNYKLKKVKIEEKEILYRLLQFALYDGSFYIDNVINEKAIFEYKWFNNYFTDNDRYAYFIKNKEIILGFVLINKNLKILNKDDGYSIAEFLIMPSYRRNKIGKNIAFELFDMFEGNWEVQPMDNNPGAYKFWQNIINEYSNGLYKIHKYKDQEDIFVFKSNNKK